MKPVTKRIIIGTLLAAAVVTIGMLAGRWLDQQWLRAAAVGSAKPCELLAATDGVRTCDSLPDLAAANDTTALLDPWDRPNLCQIGPDGSVRIGTLGADGEVGGTGGDADLTCRGSAGRREDGSAYCDCAIVSR